MMTARESIHSDVLKSVDVYQIMSSKIFGAHSETRTRDLLLTRQALFHCTTMSLTDTDFLKLIL